MLFDLASASTKRQAYALSSSTWEAASAYIPPDQEALDLAKVSNDMHELYESMIVPAGLDHFRCLRVWTGDHRSYGYLVSKVLHVTKKYKDYVGLDASMANLMRPPCMVPITYHRGGKGYDALQPL
jgi:hypothetical protein